MTPTPHTLARYSQLAYQPLEAVQAALPDATVTLLDRDDSQAYVIETVTETVVAFRGTEWRSMTDLLRNAKVRMVPLGIGQGGEVHRGYLEAADAIAEDLVQIMLDAAGKPRYYTGHSAGGSTATIARTRRPYPDYTFTFGAPKAGNREFVKAHARHHLVRYVHASDIAPMHGQVWWGYRHGGVLRKLDRDGAVTERKWRWYDEIPRGLVIGTLDHRVREYVDKQYADKLAGAEV